MISRAGLSILVIFVFSIFGNPFVFADSNDVKAKLEKATQDDKISYAIGYDVGKNLKNVITINTDLFIQGIKDSIADQPNMTQAQVQEAIKAFQGLARGKQIKAMEKKLADNKAAGTAFLEANKAKEGVTVLASGLQYKVITKGEGATPKPEDKVKCHYKGTLINGQVFDSSYKRNQPAVFPVNGVIKGWTEALQLMKTGDKWMLFVPSELAYGDRGAGETIAPGSTLIFEVELLSIEK